MAKKKTTTTKKKRTRKASPQKQENPVSEVSAVSRYTVSSGETTHEIDDLDAFCRANRLNLQMLWASRNRGPYKGWTIKENKA